MAARSALQGAFNVAELADGACRIRNRNGKDESSRSVTCRRALKKSALFDASKQLQLAASCCRAPGAGKVEQRRRAATCMIPAEWPSNREGWEDLARAARLRTELLDGTVVPEPVSEVVQGGLEARDGITNNEETDVGGAARVQIAPLAGRLLVATSKLDRHPVYSKAVVLLFGRSDEDNSALRGLILNKALPPAMARTVAPDAVLAVLAAAGASHLSPDAQEAFLSSATHFGGPLICSRPIHILATEKGVPGFHTQLTSELHMANASTLQSLLHTTDTGSTAVATDAKLFIGEIEWATRQLSCEIDVYGWWEVVESSPSDFPSCSIPAGDRKTFQPALT